jgi:ribosomal protein S18 acetylase RimI-like enzyme
VVVAEKYRGLGLSKRLLAAVEELAGRLGCCKLTLEVLEGNSIAQAAYRSLGFDAYQLDPSLGKALFWEKKLA